MDRDRKETIEPMYRRFPLFVIFLCLLFVPVIGLAAQNEPKEVVKKLDAALLEAMKGGDKLGYAGRYRLLAPVIRNSFDTYNTARIAAGQYWAGFSEEQRMEYLKTYYEWTVASYAGRFDEYSGQQFRLVSETTPERAIVTVISNLIKRNGEEVEFNYLLTQVKGVWRIVDIRVSGVSQLALTRAQFVDVLGKSGFRGLIKTLKGKIKDLEKGKGR